MRIWVGRVFILVVAFWNIQCALWFLLFPQRYTSGFELDGIVGMALVEGLGLLFLMWNVPYIVALLDPLVHRVSLIEAIIMQAIGFIGELLILNNLQDGHPVIFATLLRFIVFDGAGVVLLLAALLVTNSLRINKNKDMLNI